MLPWLVGVAVALLVAIIYFTHLFYNGFSYDNYQSYFSMPICLGVYLFFYI